MIQDNLVIAHHSFCFRLYHGRLLLPAEIIDLLKGFVIGICVYVMSYIDTSMMYHLIKSQSVIKLYLFYNMLEASVKKSTIFLTFFFAFKKLVVISNIYESHNFLKGFCACKSGVGAILAITKTLYCDVGHLN